MPSKARKISRAKKQAQIERDEQLHRDTRQLGVLGEKHMPEIQEERLTHISGHELCQRFSTQHQPLPPTLDEEVRSFKRLPSPDGGPPLAIYGSDNKLLAFRIHSKNTDLLKKLAEAIDALPQLKEWKAKGINRGSYISIHCGTWAPYMHTPRMTAEQRRAGAAADEILKLAQPFFKEMTAILGAIDPEVFKAFQSRPLPTDAQRACGAWASCVINNGGKDADEGNMHRDVREAPYGFSGALTCGDFEDGDLVMYELRRKLEMKPGDIVLFPDSLIHHRTEKVKGFRKSVVAFTQANMFDYWKRCDKGYKRPWDQEQCSDTEGKKKQRVASSRTKGKRKGTTGRSRTLRSGARY
jgi:hypothetical protein